MNTPGTTDSQKVSLSQGQKTALFGAVACLSVLIAVEPWRGRGTDSDAATAGVEALFPKFTKAAQATGIQITKFNEDTGKPHSFSVKKLQDGRWVIPSHEDYPADASQHMADAAVSVLDLKSLSMVSDRPGDFQDYGVVAPDPSKIKPGDTGIGTEVVFKGANDSVLADLIIGETDRNKEQPDLRYVRVAGRDQIYRVKLSTDKLSTRFSEWIEKDLLKINAFDIREVQLNDYSIVEGADENGRPGLTMDQRGKMVLDYDDEKSKWKLAEMAQYKAGAEVLTKLADDEELNTEKLNAMRTALDDLKIVDVQRKPAGLSKDLRVTDAFVNNREANASLSRRGFYPYRGDILSTEGEVLAFVKDGVGYTLRFGEPTLASDDDKDDAKKDEPGEDKSKKSRLNRYLFISCQFLEDRIPKPDLKELPPEPEDQKPSTDDGKKDENPPGGSATGGGATGGDAAGDSSQPEAKPAEPAPSGKQSSTTRPGNIFRLTADTKTPAAKAPAAGKPATAAPATAPPAAAAPTTAAPATQPPADSAAPPAEKAADEPAGAKPADAASTNAAPADKTDAKPAGDMPEEEGGQVRAKARAAKALADQRAAIEKENKRQQTEYDEKITKGREHAKQLNDRFADWYYIISDEVYHKIHLGRDEVIKKKDKAAGKGDGLGDFDALQKLGPGGHMHEDGEHDHDHK